MHIIITCKTILMIMAGDVRIGRCKQLFHGTGNFSIKTIKKKSDFMEDCLL